MAQSGAFRDTALQREIDGVIDNIDKDGPFPYKKDGEIFHNRERLLYHLQFGMSLFSCSMLLRNVPTPRVNQFSPKNLRTRETDCQNGWSTPTISDSIASRVCQTALEVGRWTWSHSFSIGFSSGQYGGNGRIRICSGSGCREGSG